MKHILPFPCGRILVAVLMVAAVQSARAFPDPWFGEGGFVLGGVHTSVQYSSIAVQADGRIVVAGGASTGVHGGLILARYHADGRPDESFGVDGVVDYWVDSDAYGFYGRSVAVQADGKIVVAGTVAVESGSAFAVARYHSDGSVDTSFGTDGKTVTPFVEGELVSAECRAMALQADGKIVLAGHASGGSAVHFALARYHSNGSLDTGFGGDGKVTTSFAGYYYDVDSYFHAKGESVAVQADGKIVVAGEAAYYDEIAQVGGSPFAIARYNSDGSLDEDFMDDAEISPTTHRGGKVLTHFTGYGSAKGRGVAVQADGRIVVAGMVIENEYEPAKFALARYSTSGNLDEHFGEGGQVVTGFGGDSMGGDTSVDCTDMALQADGKIVVAGSGHGDGHGGGFHGIVLARYGSDGGLDSNFGRDGRMLGAPGYGQGVAVQENGGILVSGYRIITVMPAQSSLFLARFLEYDMGPVLSPAHRVVPAEGGDRDFQVTSSGYLWSWSVSEGGEWVGSAHPANWSGNGAFHYQVAPNSSPEPRSATITLTSGPFTATHTIHQAGAIPGDTTPPELEILSPVEGAVLGPVQPILIEAELGDDLGLMDFVEISLNGSEPFLVELHSSDLTEKRLEWGYQLWPGEHTFVITAYDRASNSVSVARSFTFTETPPPTPALLRAQKPRSFPTTRMGRKSRQKTLRLTNVGGSPLTGLRVVASGRAKGDFLLVQPARRTLVPGASTVFKVAFRPRSAGLRKATLTIRSSAPPVKIPLSGRGRTRR